MLLFHLNAKVIAKAKHSRPILGGRAFDPGQDGLAILRALSVLVHRHRRVCFDNHVGRHFGFDVVTAEKWL